MKIIITIFFSIVIPIVCSADYQQNNLAWIEENIDSIFDSIKVAEMVDLDQAVIEIGAVQGEQYGFIKNKIIKYLAEKKLQLKVAAKIFKVEQFNTEIVYQEYSFGFLNLQVGLIRINNIDFNGWIEDVNGKIIKSFKVKKTITDSLQIDNRSGLEKSPYVFTRGRTNDLAIWSQIVEPIFVTGTISLMVYLLFSVRS